MVTCRELAWAGNACAEFRREIWIVLHQAFEPFPILGFPSPVVIVIYPLVPWVGVMAAGYAFGGLYRFGRAKSTAFAFAHWRDRDGALRRRARDQCLRRSGSVVHAEGCALHFLSFVNTTKYPPSLLFLLMTLGPSILALAVFETGTGRGRVREFFVTFGRVPLFFYLLQWPTAHLIAVLLNLAFGKPTARLFQTPIDWTGPAAGDGLQSRGRLRVLDWRCPVAVSGV